MHVLLRPRGIRAGAAALLAALATCLLSAGCATDTHSTREEARSLPVGEWHKDHLHCEQGECLDWYQLAVDRNAELRVDVYSPVERGLPDFVLKLEGPDGTVLENLPPTGRSPRRIRRRVEPGVYRLLVEAEERDDGLLSYEVLTSLREPPRRPARRRAPEPPPPEPARPEPSWVDAEILEVEREGGEARFVLIDAGRPKGVRSGLSGRLLQQGESIGEIEIVEVYDAGSRARIRGTLDGTITIDTRAQIAVPQAQR